MKQSDIAKLATLALTSSVLAPFTASAHAFLDHAVPGVGATVPSAPAELHLSSIEEVETALSGVRVTTAAGAAVPAGKATGRTAARCMSGSPTR